MRIILALFFIYLPLCGSYASDRSQVDTFVNNWFRGFDQHRPFEYFTDRLDDNFSIQFPERKIIRSKKDFRVWFNEVNPLKDVRHDIKFIEIVEHGETFVKVKIRVDWSASKGRQKLFFPALQNWLIIKKDNKYKIKSYNVVRGK